MVNCPKFQSGNKYEQGQILSETKKNIGICMTYSDTCHKTEDCKIRSNCKICQGKHLEALHNHIVLLGCSLAATVKLATLSMQDINIKYWPRGQMTVRVLFDNGSEVKLVRNTFTMKAEFKWQPAT